MSLDDFAKLAQAVSDLVTAAGVLLAGAWSFWLFLYSRSFAPNIQLGLSLSQVFDYGGTRVSTVRVEAKNVGRTRVRKRSCLMVVELLQEPFPSERIYPLSPNLNFLKGPRPVFEQHEWVEPGEGISEEIALAVGDKGAIHVGVEFTASPPLFRHRTSAWTVSAVFDVSKLRDNGPCSHPASVAESEHIGAVQ